MELSQPAFVVFAFVLGFLLMFVAKFFLSLVFNSIKLIAAVAIIGIAFNLSMPKQSSAYNKIVSENFDYGLSKIKTYAGNAKNELMQYSVSVKVNKKEQVSFLKKS